MIYNVLFVSEQRVKDFTPLNANVDSSELRWGISQAQTIFIQESLGTRLFEKMGELVQTNDIEDPQYIRYKELLNNYIQPTLIWYSYYMLLDSFFVKTVNIGLQQYRSEQSNPIGIKELQYLKDNAKNNAEFNDNLMRRYLVFNSSWFPEYTEYKNPEDLMPEMTGGFKASVVLPNSGYGFGGGIGGFNCSVPWWYGGRRSGE
jgi:hypothetical protein